MWRLATPTQQAGKLQLPTVIGRGLPSMKTSRLVNEERGPLDSEERAQTVEGSFSFGSQTVGGNFSFGSNLNRVKRGVHLLCSKCKSLPFPYWTVQPGQALQPDSSAAPTPSCPETERCQQVPRWQYCVVCVRVCVCVLRAKEDLWSRVQWLKWVINIDRKIVWSLCIENRDDDLFILVRKVHIFNTIVLLEVHELNCGLL